MSADTAIADDGIGPGVPDGVECGVGGVAGERDPETEAEIVENIAGLRGAYTIVAITHRPAWTKIADRLYRVSGGKVTADAADSR